MNTWVRKTLTAGALAAGALLFAPGGAAFASASHSTTADTAKHSSVSSSASHWGPDRRHGSNRHDRFRSRNSCGGGFRFNVFGGNNRGSRCWDDVDFDRFGGWGRHNGWYDDDFFGQDDYILCEDGVRRPSGHLGAGHHPAGYGDVQPATHKPAYHKPSQTKPAKPTKPAGTAPTGSAPTGSAPTGSAPMGTAPADNGYATTGGRKH